MARVVDSWPAIVHRCEQGLRTIRFRGPCRSGQRVRCVWCGEEFVYAKPQAVLHDRQPQGGRQHF